MATKSSSTSSTIIIALLVLITFPFWIGLMGAAIGIVGGIFGAIFGIIGGLFGAIVGLIVWPLKMVFGWHSWAWWPHFHFPGFAIMALIVLAIMISRQRK